MRKELYSKLTAALRAAGDGAIKHIDLWNHNVEFIEQETAWERPAVFIEFEPIQWRGLVPGIEYRAEARVRLHIVTDWSGADDGTDVFDLPELIHEAISGLEGEDFADFQLSESVTNHNHEEIVESIETYTFVAFKHSRQ